MGAMSKEHRRQHFETDRKNLGGHSVESLYLGDLLFLPGRRSLAAIVDRPGPSAETRRLEPFLPGQADVEGVPLCFPIFGNGVSRHDVNGREVLIRTPPWSICGEPGIYLGAERRPLVLSGRSHDTRTVLAVLKHPVVAPRKVVASTLFGPTTRIRT